MKINFYFLGNSLMGQIIRAALMYTFMLGMSILGFLMAIPLYFFPIKRQEAMLWVTQTYINVLMKYFIGKVHISGHENLQKCEGPFIFISNHESYWDAMGLVGLCHPVAFVIKKYVLLLPFANMVIQMMYFIKVDVIANGEKRRQKITEQAMDFLARKISVIFFGQGSRVRDGSQPPIKKGSIILAIKSNRPIIPIVHNSIKIWPGHILTKTGDVHIVFGEPIYPDGKSADELKEEVEKWIYSERAKLEV